MSGAKDMSGVQSKICRLRGEKTIIIYETLHPLVSNFLGSRKARYGPMLHFLILWSSNASLSSAVRIQWYQLQAYAFLRLNYSFRAFASFMLITQLLVTPHQRKKKKKKKKTTTTTTLYKTTAQESRRQLLCVLCKNTPVFMTLFFLRKK